jgi:hypothetical protein
MLKGNIPTLEAPHKQPSTISNYEKREKKRSLHLAARTSATPPTQASKLKVLNTVKSSDIASACLCHNAIGSVGWASHTQVGRRVRVRK